MKGDIEKLSAQIIKGVDDSYKEFAEKFTEQFTEQLCVVIGQVNILKELGEALSASLENLEERIDEIENLYKSQRRI
ncbi:hypothetical protein LCGC14_0433050 [marine sediment metagenome]|uniref:Uncharacterized protein n=1 Tax=marine sediment metagenome TaxID=412755 RepID=A0A0F9STZ2_9ZZZZ